MKLYTEYRDKMLFGTPGEVVNEEEKPVYTINFTSSKLLTIGRLTDLEGKEVISIQEKKGLTEDDYQILQGESVIGSLTLKSKKGQCFFEMDINNWRAESNFIEDFWKIRNEKDEIIAFIKRDVNHFFKDEYTIDIEDGEKPEYVMAIVMAIMCHMTLAATTAMIAGSL